jgi:hypothetical protein
LCYLPLRRDGCHPIVQLDGLCCGWIIEIIRLVYHVFLVFSRCQEKQLPQMARYCGVHMRLSVMVESHPAIMLVTAYIVERGLILEPYEVSSKTNEINALPAFIKQMALKGVVFAFDAISTQKNSSNHH